ncbi:MAG: hypothetical protein ACO30K_14450 [bacterium]
MKAPSGLRVAWRHRWHATTRVAENGKASLVPVAGVRWPGLWKRDSLPCFAEPFLRTSIDINVPDSPVLRS